MGYLDNPQSQHPYMYCRGNPVRYSDPSGYEAITITTGTAIAVGGILITVIVINTSPQAKEAARQLDMEMSEAWDSGVRQVGKTATQVKTTAEVATSVAAPIVIGGIKGHITKGGKQNVWPSRVPRGKSIEEYEKMKKAGEITADEFNKIKKDFKQKKQGKHYNTRQILVNPGDRDDD